MRKIDSLRAAIAAALPELATSPDRLRMWIEQGSARSVQTASEGFAFGFRLNILVVELAGDLALLALPVFRWLRANQPELLAAGAEGFTFDADLLDNQTADILIQLDITQNVAVIDRPGGAAALEYLAEPDPLFGAELLAGGPLLKGADAEEEQVPWA